MEPTPGSALHQGKSPTSRYQVAPIREKCDVFINVYEPKGAIHTEQTGKSPHRSIRGKRYQMILHEIDGNSNRIEPMKNKTEGEMILARSCALERMKAQDIVRTNRILDNEISTKYIL